MKSNKQCRAAILAVILTASMLSGCGSSGNSSSSNSAAPSAATSATEMAASAVSEANAQVESANASTATQATTQAEEVTFSSVDDITNMSPWSSRTNTYSYIMNEVYETMGAFDKLGGTFSGVLMESWKQKDDKTFECKLYQNITDSDGNPITASDVKFSYESCWAQGELAETTVIKECNVVDDYTVDFVWGSVPGAGAFESVMSDVFIVSQKAFEASSDKMVTTPVGTGPYKVTDYVSGSSVTIEATGKYWQDPSKFTVPTQYSNVKKINCQVISESAQIAMALQTNAIDISDMVNTEDLAAFDEGGANAEGHKLFSFPYNSGESLMANMSSDSKMSDINLRKAVFAAIDQNGLMQMVSGGKTLPLATFGGTTYSDYEEKWNDTNLPYDLDAAKKYLAQSAYADGCTLNLIVIQGNSRQEEESLAIQSYLQAIGITVNIQTLPIAQYLPQQADTKGWDIQIAGFPSTAYLVNCWAKYFDLNTVGDTTVNFMKDDEFQSLVETALSIDGHTPENMDKVVAYLQDNAIMKGLCESYQNAVYNSNLISEVVLDQYDHFTPGAFTYNVQ